MAESTQKTKSSARPVPPRGGYVFVRESVYWYKDQYRRSLYLALVLASILLVSLVLNIYLFVSRPKPVYFATTQDMRVMRLQPLDVPYVSTANLLNFAVQTVSAVSSLNYINYKGQLEAQRDNFTPEAFDEFVRALKSSGILDLIIKERLSMQAEPQAAPVISEEGVGPDGAYTWKISYPMNIIYQSSSGQAGTQPVIVSLIIKRQNILQYHGGVAITQLKLLQPPGAYSSMTIPPPSASTPASR